MNCFRHIEEPAVGTGEVYIGRDSSGEIYGIRPLCKPCFDSVVERVELKKRAEKAQGNVIFGVIAVLVLICIVYSIS